MRKMGAERYIFSGNIKKVGHMSIWGNSRCRTMIPTKNKLMLQVGKEM